MNESGWPGNQRGCLRRPFLLSPLAVLREAYQLLAIGEACGVLSQDSGCRAERCEVVLMKMKYVEERFPLWFKNDEVDVSDGDRDLLQGISPEEADLML